MIILEIKDDFSSVMVSREKGIKKFKINKRKYQEET